MALSPLQQGLFAMTSLTDPGASDPYVIAMAADVTGSLDVSLLRDCAATMLTRHPNLRASFVHGNLSHPVQVIPSAVEVPWRQVRATPDEVETLEAEERRRRFDLGRGPLIRFLLVELPDRRWHLVIVAHHLVIDGWSLPLFVSELLALYRAGGDGAALPPSPRPYRDYIGWLAGRDQTASRALWAQHLAGLDGPTLLSPALTATPPRAGIPRRTTLRLDRDATTALAEAARARGVTLNTLIQMAWAAILSVLTDRSDVTFGVTVSGRPDELSGVETMVGLFINTVPLRVRVDPRTTVGAQCAALQRESAALRDHSYLGHAESRALAGIGELFDSLLVYENFPPGAVVGATEFAANGATFRPATLESVSHFPVTIAAHLSAGELTVLVEVLDGALGTMAPDGLGRRLLATLQRLVDKWDRPLREVDILLDDEQRPIPPAPGPNPVAVHIRFAEMAAALPDSVAVGWADGRLTYGELDALADRLAAALSRGGVGSETPVAITLPRGPGYVAAMLAVLKAGGTIVPLDPAMPEDRVAEILRQTSAPIVIDGKLFTASAETATPADYRAAPVPPDHAAYAVFTSGTTGAPKGVVGTHRALSAYVDDHIERVLRPAAARLGRPLRVAHAWSFTFDAAWQPLAALLDGHVVHIIGDDDQRDAEALVAAIDRFGLDMIDTTPSMFAQLHTAGLLRRVPLAILALGGEALGSAAWQAIQRECARTAMTAFNCYGPTETTVEAVVAAIDEHARPTIGRPTRTTRAYVMDSWLRPVPDGAAGELYLAGDQLTRGYLGRAAETAARFVADPHACGGRMYRTGDVVRRMPDGGLEFLGRSDDQLKIRGFRVEPGEIVAALNGHDGVRGAHVTARSHANGPRLTAYVAGGPNPPTVAELRSMLLKRLPRYLVPHHIVVLDELPLTPHGKIDEKALAATGIAADRAVPPETPTEAALAEAFTDILEIADVDVTAGFLEMGLDSIVALSVVQAARRRGIALRARLMTECETIRELAAAIDEDAEQLVTAEASGPIPLLPNAHWLYEYGEPRRLAQTEAIRLPDTVTREHLRAALAALIDGHEVLRTSLDRAAMTLLEGPIPDFLTEVDVEDLHAAVTAQASAAVERLDPERGTLLAAVWLRPPSGGSVLLLAAHVLAMDPASWRVVLGELDSALTALAAGRPPAPVREHTSYRRWAAALSERARRLDTVGFWRAQLEGDDPDIGARRIRPGRDVARDLVVRTALVDADVSGRLLKSQAPLPDLLVAATAAMLTGWRRARGQATPPPLLALETHGRADALLDEPGARAVDTGDTVGLLSSIYPLRVDPARPVAEQLAEIPGHGIDYGLLRYLRADTAGQLAGFPGPQLLLNYLGAAHTGGGTALRLDRELLADVSPVPEPELAVRHELTILAVVLTAGEQRMLATQWRALPDILDDADMAALQQLWTDNLREVAT
ncbi:non-ribosomal peptide synthetase [Mycobacterium sp. 852002-50816_SCH5313054-b]|uniref:non-ribosomal peptide synthetase n=1 Tax=Mycobacterium sp. 852002-50816_SCH5313054-b TaxID=1834092 RepID=UPI000802544B|nr:non-ribosomal peptide synthetase [Mycobacterium sp. 852002-50816_SCH5313054-b]OBF62768.1 non-ribosomal peptide synthetase [Mycobacterium sp. 852002-50816_SCH5313054-b]